MTTHYSKSHDLGLVLAGLICARARVHASAWLELMEERLI